MRVIILEALYLLAILGAVGTLAFILFSSTPAGVRWRQERNRRAAERRSPGLDCPIHGAIAESALVRLPTGERMCPRCYKETL